MDESAKDLIFRGKLALRGKYSIALGERDTTLFRIGLERLQKRYRPLKNITYTYHRVEMLKLLAKRCIDSGVSLKLHGTDIKLLIKAIRLGSRHKTVTCIDQYTKDAEGNTCKKSFLT